MIASIQLRQTQVKAVDFQLTNDELDEGKMEMSFGVGYDDGEDSTFLVTFNITITAESYSLKLAYMAVFETSEPINDEFRSSHFPVVNAPAIAYPFMRAFISNLTMNASYNPLILPAVNFQALNERQNKAGREVSETDKVIESDTESMD